MAANKWDSLFFVSTPNERSYFTLLKTGDFRPTLYLEDGPPLGICGDLRSPWLVNTYYPETNELHLENGWLEYFFVSEIGAISAYFQGANLRTLVSGRVVMG